MKPLTLILLTLLSCTPKSKRNVLDKDAINFNKAHDYFEKSKGSHEAFTRVYNMRGEAKNLDEAILLEKVLNEILVLSKQYGDSAINEIVK